MNNSDRTRRQLIIRFIHDFLDGVLEETIDRIPVLMRPHDFQANRCCVYKDRAMLRYRMMALMGFGMEEETDESRSLRSYYSDVKNHVQKDQSILSVCTVGCAGCVDSHVQVTDSCVGCFARPCVSVCPKQAVSVINQRSIIDRDKCVDCGKCITVCPYKAIVRNPLPCEDSCPVKAIGKNAEGRVQIDPDRCIYCGKCFKACPFSTIMERSDLLRILFALKSDRPLVAMLAPAVTKQFPGKLEQLFAALKLAGFAEIFEVALGAELTTRHEAEEFYERMANGDKLMTSSCCPAWVEMAKKHLPEILPMVSSTPSPMAFTGQIVAKHYFEPRTHEAVKVFIGPCIAKRLEAQRDPNVDYVMTFEELGALLAALGVDIQTLDAEPLLKPAASYAREFASSCGVTQAILYEIGLNGQNGGERVKLEEKAIDGIDRKTLPLLKMYAKGTQPINFLEVMACQGGCVGGPCSLAR